MNVDIGEGFPFDEQLLEFASSANVCCGEHAGSWALTEATVALCLASGKRFGAHPGFPDRPSMGRAAPSDREADDWAESVVFQATRFCRAFPSSYVKPHGSLYNLVTRPLDTLEGLSPQVLHTCDRALEKIGRVCRLPFMLARGCPALQRYPGSIVEGFADRRYEPDGSLAPRGRAGAILADRMEIRSQVLELATSVDSICIHGDHPGAPGLAEFIYASLLDAGYEVGP